MNKNIAEIIDALTAHEDTSSIQVLEELGTNSPDNEIREYTSRALVKKNLQEQSPQQIRTIAALQQQFQREY